MSDYIERDKIMNFCNAVINRQGNEEEMNVVVESFKAFAEYVKVLQSAQPERKWILCSERLPKPGYCITSNEHNGVSEDFYYDGHFWNADKNAYEVIAWMPLPEPAKLEND